jgi:hypothetical protein
VAERPPDPDLDRDFAHANGWDREFDTYDDFDLPTYVGPVSFMKLPWVTDPAELRRREVDLLALVEAKGQILLGELPLFGGSVVRLQNEREVFAESERVALETARTVSRHVSLESPAEKQVRTESVK